MLTCFRVGRAFFSSQIYRRCVPLITETELADFRRNASGYTCFNGPLVQPALVERMIVESFLGGRTSHVVVEGELFHEAGVWFSEGAGLPYEAEGGLRIEFGVLREQVGDQKGCRAGLAHGAMNQYTSSTVKPLLDEGIAGGKMFDGVLVFQVIELNDVVFEIDEEMTIKRQPQHRYYVCDIGLVQSFLAP